MSTTIVGKVKNLFLYPVKSMRGVVVSEATCHWYGFNGDRKYAFIRHDAHSGFPWLTGRDVPQLLQYQPTFVDVNNLLTSPIMVQTPNNQQLPLQSPELQDEITSLYGRSISLLKLKRGTFDCMPISIMTTHTLQALKNCLGSSVDLRRFRPNIIIEAESDVALPENEWLTHSLTFGQRATSAQLNIDYPIQRCVMINLEPESGQKDPHILKSVATHLNSCVGVYASAHTVGSIKVGDTVALT